MVRGRHSGQDFGTVPRGKRVGFLQLPSEQPASDAGKFSITGYSARGRVAIEKIKSSGSDWRR